MKKSNKEKIPYVRIGTTYYKMIEQPLASGKDTVKKLVEWSKEIINLDHTKNFIHNIPKYDGFCTIPSHTNYKREHGTFYNRYEPFEHIAIPGDFKNTLFFIKHIFGDQYEYGLDYIQLLYTKPEIKLPIVVLVSEEKRTGKTTFLNYLKAIFTNNMTLNSNEDFKSDFNSDWADKLIIGVDETLLNKKEESERFKNLSTSEFIKNHAKNKNKSEIQFFGKFVFNSNNETNCIYIEKNEVRYWVRKVPVLEKRDPFFLEKLKHEIPHFLHFLQNRQMKVPKSEDRMWFKPERLHTKALDRIKRNTRPVLEIELETNIKELLIESEADEISLSYTDIMELLKGSGIRNLRKDAIRSTLKSWDVHISKNTDTYIKYHWSRTTDGEIYLAQTNSKARIFTFTKNLFKDDPDIYTVNTNDNQYNTVEIEDDAMPF